jgi:hypothetical protein
VKEAPTRSGTEIAAALILWAILALAPGIAHAQDIEPRAYSNTPVGVNFLIGGYAGTRGDLSFDSNVPITNARLNMSSALVAYVRSLDIAGMSGKFDVALPYSWLSGTADVAGRPAERVVDGFNDARLRLSVNLYGAPALDLEQFAAYQQDLIIGASFAVTAPVGQYDPSRLINLGTNRWAFRPEVGMSKALGRLTLELTTGVNFYTANDDFFGGRTRTQEPIFAVQGHAIYSFVRGIWGSLDVTYFTGGRSAIDGDWNNDLQRNWRAGASLAIPLGRQYSIRLYGSRGMAARTGNNYDLVGVALQYRWGGGL